MTKALLFALILGAAALHAQPEGIWQGYDGEWGHVSRQLIALADATPAEKFTWRPAPGVRSIAEVLLHASAANYNMYKLVGVPIPPGLDVENFEQSTTDKTKIIAMLKESYAHAKKAITDLPDANLEKTMDWAGGKVTYRGMLLYIVPHIAEHLGQLIAYARINGVVPPWSEDAKK